MRTSSMSGGCELTGLPAANQPVLAGDRAERSFADDDVQRERLLEAEAAERAIVGGSWYGPCRVEPVFARRLHKAPLPNPARRRRKLW